MVRKKVIHAAGPDLRTSKYFPKFGSTADESVVQALSTCYFNVLAEFAHSGCLQLRLPPISSGIFSGGFGHEMPRLTAQALARAFEKLAPAEREHILQSSAIELCISTGGVDKFAAALRDEQIPNRSSIQENSLLVCAVAVKSAMHTCAYQSGWAPPPSSAPVRRVGDAVVIADAQYVVPLFVASLGQGSQASLVSDSAWCQRLARIANAIHEGEGRLKGLQAARDRREVSLRQQQEELTLQTERRLKAIEDEVARWNSRQAAVLRRKAQRAAQQKKKDRDITRFTKRLSCMVECS